MASAQDFVDDLNFKLYPQMGYTLGEVDGNLYWFWNNVKTYPANEKARHANT